MLSTIQDGALEGLPALLRYLATLPSHCDEDVNSDRPIFPTFRHVGILKAAFDSLLLLPAREGAPVASSQSSLQQLLELLDDSMCV